MGGGEARDDFRDVPKLGAHGAWVRREILWAGQQLPEAGGRGPREMVDLATKAKRAWAASAAAPVRDDDPDDK